MTPTCETAGVLGPAVAVIASFEAVEAIKVLSGAHDALNKELIMVDVWDWTFRRLKVARLMEIADCPCCKHRKFEWLDGALTLGRFRELLPEADALVVQRHAFPNLRALNFVVVGLLGEGVASSTRPDPQAKGLGEYLRSRIVDIPIHLAPDQPYA